MPVSLIDDSAQSIVQTLPVCRVSLCTPRTDNLWLSQVIALEPWSGRNNTTSTAEVKLARDAVLLNKTNDFMVADRGDEGFIH